MGTFSWSAICPGLTHFLVMERQPFHFHAFSVSKILFIPCPLQFTNRALEINFVDSPLSKHSYYIKLFVHMEGLIVHKLI